MRFRTSAVLVLSLLAMRPLTVSQRRMADGKVAVPATFQTAPVMKCAALPATVAPVLKIAAGAASIRFIAFGDQGSGKDTRDQRDHQYAVGKLIQDYYQNKPAPMFALLLGDNFYKTPDFSEFFSEPYKYLLDKGVQFYAVLGNHDYENNRVSAELGARQKGWNMPAKFYALNAGPAVLFGLDTASGKIHDGPNFGNEQKGWLLHSLCESTAPWKIVFGHHSILSGGMHGYRDRQDEELDRMLLDVVGTRADLYIAGHDHDVQLLKKPGLPAILNIGSGGRGVRRVYPVADMTHFCASAHGFAEVELTAHKMTISLIVEDLGSKETPPRPKAVCTLLKGKSGFTCEPSLNVSSCGLYGHTPK